MLWRFESRRGGDGVAVRFGVAVKLVIWRPLSLKLGRKVSNIAFETDCTCELVVPSSCRALAPASAAASSAACTCDWTL